MNVSNLVLIKIGVNGDKKKNGENQTVCRYIVYINKMQRLLPISVF